MMVTSSLQIRIDLADQIRCEVMTAVKGARDAVAAL